MASDRLKLAQGEAEQFCKLWQKEKRLRQSTLLLLSEYSKTFRKMADEINHFISYHATELHPDNCNGTKGGGGVKYPVGWEAQGEQYRCGYEEGYREGAKVAKSNKHRVKIQNAMIEELAEVLATVPDDDPIQRAETPGQYLAALRALLKGGGK